MDSGSHLPPGGGASVKKKVNEDGGQSRNVVGDFKNAWHLFDGAGSQLLYMMCSTLSGTQLGGITRDLMALQGPVFGCSKSELVLGRLKEMENLLAGLQIQKNETEEISSAQVQMLCRCLLLFIKLQAEYHQMCSNSVSMVINHLAASSDCQENRDLLHQMKALELNKYATSRQSPTRNIGHKKSSVNSNIGSPKSQKQGSFKASLFSLFERKNSPEEGNSSFYVDIGQHNTDEASQETDKLSNEMKAQSHMTSNNQSDVLIQLGLDPNQSEVSADEKSKTQDNDKSPKSAISLEQHLIDGQVASQEELESVINLLSGSGLNGLGMETIPEVTSSNPVLRLQGNSQHNSGPSSAVSDSSLDGTGGMRNQSQRRSEGSIDLSGFTHQGHNTWPYQHRASLPGGQSLPQFSYDFSGPPVQHPYNNGPRPAMTLPPGGAAQFQAYNLGFPDPKLNRALPVNNLAGPGMETVGGFPWSGILDSDDMSDDSSVGDQFHMMSQYQNMENSFFNHEDTLAAFRKDDRSGDVKHHSLEDLLDGRSNTWPQQFQSWSHSSQGLNLRESTDNIQHRPVTMQLSDPLTQRNVWINPVDGTLHTTQSQNIYGTGQM